MMWCLWCLPLALATDSAPVAVIGAGYSGLSAALELRAQGYDVVLYEQHDRVGGRAYQVDLKGFQFDAGPSWYWMPDVFETLFARHGRKVSDFYGLQRLEPAYRIRFEDEVVDVPGTSEAFRQFLFDREPQSEGSINHFLDEAKYKYNLGINEWVRKPMVSWKELLDPKLVYAALSLDMFGSFEANVNETVTDPKLRTILKWPTIFLGASPREAPSLYSLMTYGGHELGTWYPEGGMAAPARALGELARSVGVDVRLSSAVTEIKVDGEAATHVCTAAGCDEVTGIVAAADYWFVEQYLLPRSAREHDQDYWSEQVLAPSCLLFYLGFKTDLGPAFAHHTFFFEAGLDEHLHAVYDNVLPQEYVFYVSATTRTDPQDGFGDALFVLVPIIEGADTIENRALIFDKVMKRMSAAVGRDIAADLVAQQAYGPTDFEKEFHALRGNAFGHANVLEQSLLFKPSMRSKLLNLVYAGHLTSPGPGVPPALVSGQVAAKLLDEQLKDPGVLRASHAWLLTGMACCALLLFALKRGDPTRAAPKHLRQSYRLCIDMFEAGGKTYFLGATQLSDSAFLHTAAIYALARHADDIVDTLEPGPERAQNLRDFENGFWAAMEGHGTQWAFLPAVVDAVKQRKYERELFERFFTAMRSDCGQVKCETFEETDQYMWGSAVVFGEFMLPILMPESSAAAIEAALPHARDLGRALQLTNFLRDIGEDQVLHRQYVPVAMCEEYGCELKPGQKLGPLLEAGFAIADKYYESADKGIQMLPKESRKSIQVAMAVYHGIHDEIRKNDYDVFSKRATVSSKRRLALARQHLTPLDLGKLLLGKARGLVPAVRAGLGLFLWAYLLERVDGRDTTYAQFHLLVTLPPIALLLLCRRAADRAWRVWTAVLSAVAFVWTTPWDNYLVASGAWKYEDGKVLGVVGYVPYEEYAFFVLQTVLVSLSITGIQLHQPPVFRSATPHRRQGLLILGLLFGLGVSLLPTNCGFYLGMILAWSCPVLALQWAYGADALMANSHVYVNALACAVYLALADRWAIRYKIWEIEPKLSLPRLDYLPIEEGLFFVITSLMCCQGLTLAVVAATLRDLPKAGWGRRLEVLMAWQLKPPEPACGCEAKPPTSRRTCVALYHAVAANVATLGLCLLYRLAGPWAFETQVGVLAATTAVFGMPHGALDMVLLKQLATRQKRGLRPLVVGYVGLSAATVLAWQVSPLSALLLFLCASVAHFGEGDASTKLGPGTASWLEVFVRGGMILRPLGAYPGECARVFQILAGDRAGLVLAQLAPLRLVHLACLAALLGKHWRSLEAARSALLVVELLVLAACFTVLPPLLSFVLYFNLYHGARHVLRVASATQLGKGHLKGPALATLVPCVVGVAYVAAAATRGLTGVLEHTLRAVFIGLSALTAPHMLLVGTLVYRRQL